jgi:hypothetical protein
MALPITGKRRIVKEIRKFRSVVRFKAALALEVLVAPVAQAALIMPTSYDMPNGG